MFATPTISARMAPLHPAVSTSASTCAAKGRVRSTLIADSPGSKTRCSTSFGVTSAFASKRISNVQYFRLASFPHRTGFKKHRLTLQYASSCMAPLQEQQHLIKCYSQQCEIDIDSCPSASRFRCTSWSVLALLFASICASQFFMLFLCAHLRVFQQKLVFVTRVCGLLQTAYRVWHVDTLLQ